jgi:hypothetical protein
VIKNAAVHGEALMVGHHNVAMGQDQMYEKLTRLARDKKTFRLEALNDARQIVNLQRSLDEHKRLLQAIADSELPRVHQLIRVGIDHGDSARAISKRVAKAATEFTRMESTSDDKDLALLTLRIGGPFLLYAHQRAGHLPGTTTARGHSSSALLPSRFRVSLTAQADIERPTLKSNLQSVRDEPNNGGGMFGEQAAFSAIMIDEFATQQRPRWRQSDNAIVGMCQHAGEQNVELKLTCQAVLDTLVAKVQEHTIHIAKEVSNIGIAPFRGDNNHFRPLLCTPTCKLDANVNEQVRTFETVIEELVLSGANPACLSSDGDGPRRQALTQLCTINNLRSVHEEWCTRRDAVGVGGKEPAKPRAARIYEALRNALLFDYLVGPHEVTEDYDWKHLLKRMRELLKSPNGSHRIAGITVRTQDHKDAFRDILKYDEKRIALLFHPEQRQSVEEAVDFLVSLAEISYKEISDFPAYNKVEKDVIFYAMQFMGRICDNLVRAFLDPTTSVSGHLALLSELSAMLFLGYGAELDQGGSAERVLCPHGAPQLSVPMCDVTHIPSRLQKYVHSGGAVSRSPGNPQALLHYGSQTQGLRAWLGVLPISDWR